MTTYNIAYIENDVMIEVEGHTGYADSGFDIVCASVTAISNMTGNLIDNLGYNIVAAKSIDGYYMIRVERNEQVDKIILTFKEMMDSISKQYPKFVKLKS